RSDVNSFACKPGKPSLDCAPMNLLDELARTNADPAVIAQVRALIEQSAQKDVKIRALTLELVHHKRIRYGHKNEALSPEQRDLFQECWNTDLAAMEAEVEQLSDIPPARRTPKKPTGRQPLPAHLPRIEHRHEPASCACGQCGAD